MDGKVGHPSCRPELPEVKRRCYLRTDCWPLCIRSAALLPLHRGHQCDLSLCEPTCSLALSIQVRSRLARLGGTALVSDAHEEVSDRSNCPVPCHPEPEPEPGACVLHVCCPERKSILREFGAARRSGGGRGAGKVREYIPWLLRSIDRVGWDVSNSKDDHEGDCC